MATEAARLFIEFATRGAEQAAAAMRGVGAAGQQAAAGTVAAETAVTRANRAFVSLAGTLRSFAGGLVAGIGFAFVARELVQITKDLVQAGLEFEKVNDQMRLMTGSSAEATAQLRLAAAVAKQYGLDLRTLENGLIDLRAATAGTSIEGKVATDVFRATAEAIGALNLTVQESTAVFEVINKAIIGMPLRLAQLPVAIQAVFKPFIVDGKIAADRLDDLAAAMHEAFGGAALREAKDADASFQRLSDAILRLQRALGSSGIVGLLADIADGLTAFLDSEALRAGGRALNEILDQLNRHLKGTKTDLENLQKIGLELFPPGFIKNTLRELELLLEVGKKINELLGIKGQRIGGPPALGMDPGSLAKFEATVRKFTRPTGPSEEDIEAARKAAAEADKLRLRTEQDEINKAADALEEYLRLKQEIGEQSARDAENQRHLTDALNEGDEAFKQLNYEIDAQAKLWPIIEAAKKADIELSKEWLQTVRDQLIEAEKLRDEQQAVIDARREAEQKQQRDIEAAAEAAKKPWENAAENIQNTFTDTFQQILNDGKLTFSSLADAVKQIFTRLAAELIALRLFGPLFGQIAAGGMAPAGGAAAVPGGALGFATLFGGGTTQPPGLPGSARYAAVTGRPIGTAGVPYGPQGFTGGVAGGALGIGGAQVAGGFLGIDTTSNLALAGGAIGGIAGGIAGSAIPGVGTFIGAMAGSAVGSLIGGLLGGGKDKPPQQDIATGLRLRGGLLGAEALHSRHGEAAITGDIADQAVKSMNAILLGIGARMTGLPDRADISYFGRQPQFRTDVGGTQRKFGQDADAAMADFIVRVFKNALAEGDIEGTVSETIKTVLRNTAASTVQELEADIEFGKLYDQLVKGTAAANEAATAIRELHDQFAQARLRADELGLSVAEVEAAYSRARLKLTTDFDKEIRLALLDITDPLAAELERLDELQAQRILNARQLGADLVAVERLNGLERLELVRQQGESINAFAESLIQGPLSAVAPQEQFRAAQANYQALAAQASAGSGAALGQFPAAAQQYLSLARQFYASSPQYASIFQNVLSTTQGLGGTAAVPGAGPLATGALTQPLESISEGFVSLTQTVAASGAETVRAVRESGKQISDKIEQLRKSNDQFVQAEILTRPRERAGR